MENRFFKFFNKLIKIILLCLFLSSCAFVQKSNPLKFQAPLKKYKITQKFKPFKRPPHLGIDLKANWGTPVLSSQSGKVVYAGQKFTGYGKVIIIEHDSDWTSLYSHLSQIKVKLGQKIKQGQVIGFVGSTGRSSGPHLHFEILYKKRNVNPIQYIN